MGEEYWDKREAMRFLRVSRATLDRYVARFDIQKSSVEGGRKIWFRAEDIRRLIGPIKDDCLPELNAAASLTPTATASQPSVQVASRQRGRASGQLVLPAHPWGANSLLGILALESAALRAPALMLSAAPLIAWVTVQVFLRTRGPTFGATTP